MKLRLLQYLACPSCGGAINLLSAARSVGEEILDGDLDCKVCTRRFPIVRGVPRFSDSAKIETGKATTAINFGWEWQHFKHADERYRQQFLNWIAPIEPEFFQNKVVLEAGCGKGRHTQLAAEWKARDVIGVDLSDAVEVAFAATRETENAHIIQADINNLPVRRVFDYAFSVGVLHHLPRPREGFLALAAKVKPGGYLSAWIYGAENNEWIMRWVSPVRENISSRMNLRALLHLSKLPTAVLYAVTKFMYGPLNRSITGVRYARRLFYNDYLQQLSGFGWREHHTIVFDHLVAPTSHYITRAEFEGWWKAIGARDVQLNWHNRNSWRGTGRVGL